MVENGGGNNTTLFKTTRLPWNRFGYYPLEEQR